MEKQQISAKIVAHSKSSVNAKEIVTFELNYPRFCHSELMTHRMFSRNAASSRAIPVAKVIEQVRENPAMPIHWGKNQSGMQAKEELEGQQLKDVKVEWLIAADGAADSAAYMSELGAHKQIVNRILEPFQLMKTVVTATEWKNFFWLRNSPDAQPEIKRLAEVMLEALEGSEPFMLGAGEWHTPYYADGYWIPRGTIQNTDGSCTVDQLGFTLQQALAISSSCCAQVSYRKLDDSLEKALDIYARLVESEPVHASPFEHQATPMKEKDDYSISHRENDGCNLLSPCTWENGITHSDVNGNLWSGNLMGFIQHRQLIPNNVVQG